VRAILRGYADAVADPQAAVDAAKAVFPQYYEREDVALAHAVLLGKYMEEQAAPEGFGFQSESDWASTLDLLETYFGLKDPRAPSEYFTNEFLPEDDLLAN
jgi:ABC-type nitrate/sulfonate/bicarbonate transport system substrate-binding protein